MTPRRSGRRGRTRGRPFEWCSGCRRAASASVVMCVVSAVWDGVEATKGIRALGISCPIIAVTSATTKELKTLTEVGFNFVSYKPVELEKIIKIITMFV